MNIDLLTLNHYKNEFILNFIYVKIKNKKCLQDLKADPKDEFLAILRATIKGLTYPVKYFEKRLRLSIEKTGTDESALSRIVATRAEFDMKIIKEEYKKRSSVSLDQAIAKDTRGDYEDMLLALVGTTES